MENTIWSLKDTCGRSVQYFEGMAQVGIKHFQNIFKADGGVTIDAIVHIALYFPRFVEERDNRALMEEVTKEEVKEVLHRFQKYKSLEPDDWSIDFFMWLFDIIGKDILKVVE